MKYLYLRSGVGKTLKNMEEPAADQAATKLPENIENSPTSTKSDLLLVDGRSRAAVEWAVWSDTPDHSHSILGKKRDQAKVRYRFSREDIISLPDKSPKNTLNDTFDLDLKKLREYPPYLLFSSKQS